ncbi:MAG: AAA family ATPase [Calditrichaeota bacterium]|nr:AAA family ATPase [Calditrichota bacterium]
MANRMEHMFTLYIRKHVDNSYTVKVVEAQFITAHGVVQQRCKDQVRTGLFKLSKKLNPEQFREIKYYPGSTLSSIEIEMQPKDHRNRRRRTKLKGEISFIITPYEDQFLITVPVLRPLIKFFVDRRENIQKLAKDELMSYLNDFTAEEIIPLFVDKKEWIETTSVKLHVQESEEVLKEESKMSEDSMLEIAENVTSLAKDKQFDRAYEVDDKVNEVLDILSSEKRESIVIIGKSMSGKSAVFNEVAYRIVKKQCAKPLFNREIWLTSPEKIESSPQWSEGVLQNMVDYARQENCIIWFEDLIEILNASTTFIHGAKIAKYFKEYIARGEIVVMGEADPSRFEKFMTRYSGFLSLFRQIRMHDVNDDKAYFIANAVRKKLELQNKIKISTDAIDLIIELTNRFEPYWYNPGKSINLLKQIVRSRLTEDNELNKIDQKDVFRIFSRQTGLPENILSEDPPLRLDKVEEFFHTRVMGQDKAVDSMVDLISTIKAGLNDPQKPLGNFIFLGPTGVGKTFLARSLSEYIFGSDERMIRLDMSEYSSYDAVQKLLGVPGSNEERGILTSSIIEQPFSLILLDEIEKAHQSVFDLLLQVLGEGRLTSASGQTVDFRSAIIIMTSNLGASSKEMKSVGFGGDELNTDFHYIEKMEKFFRPEFINRIDHIVPFNSLDKDSVRKIAENELDRAISRYGILRRQVTLEVDDLVLDEIIKNGFSPVYGARPVKRAIEKIVISPLSRFLASKNRKDLDFLKLNIQNGKTVVKSVSLENPDIKIESTDPFSRKYSGANLRELRLKTGELRRRTDEILQSDKYDEINRQLQNLMKKTTKGFWDKTEKERSEISDRIFTLDRLIKSIQQLNSEAHYLEDLTDVVGRQKDLDYLTHIAQKYNSLENKISFTEIEFANSNEINNKALLEIRRLNQHRIGKEEQDWFKLVCKIYVKWLFKKQYSFDVFLLKLPTEKEEKEKDKKPAFEQITFSSQKDLEANIDAQSNPLILVFQINGPNVQVFLRGEKGIHKLSTLLPGEKETKHQHRIVEVDVNPAISTTESILQLKINEAVEKRQKRKKSWKECFNCYVIGNEDVAREFRYSNDKYKIIDTRSELVTSQIETVLNGNLDPFILTRIRKRMHSLEEED